MTSSKKFCKLVYIRHKIKLWFLLPLHIALLRQISKKDCGSRCFNLKGSFIYFQVKINAFCCAHLINYNRLHCCLWNAKLTVIIHTFDSCIWHFTPSWVIYMVCCQLAYIFLDHKDSNKFLRLRVYYACSNQLLSVVRKKNYCVVTLYTRVNQLCINVRSKNDN